MSDPVHHPAHYTGHPSGVECITVVQHMGFCLGNVVKYVWRADLKGNAIEDLEKARFYLDQEIARRKAVLSSPQPIPDVFLHAAAIFPADYRLGRQEHKLDPAGPIAAEVAK